jgi:hypothetical protein
MPVFESMSDRVRYFPVKLLRGAAVARSPDEEVCPVPKLTRRVATTTMARALAGQYPIAIYKQLMDFKSGARASSR